MTGDSQRFSVARKRQLVGRRARDLVTILSLERSLLDQLQRLAVARQRGFTGELCSSHVAGCLATVKVISSRAHHSDHSATLSASWRATSGRTACCRSTNARSATARNVLFDCELFIGLSDVPGNAFGVLNTLGETLALALVKRPGSGEVWRSSLRSQGKH